jgi:hypothetical protein
MREVNIGDFIWRTGTQILIKKDYRVVMRVSL